jgi:hypothetical protein
MLLRVESYILDTKGMPEEVIRPLFTIEGTKSRIRIRIQLVGEPRDKFLLSHSPLCILMFLQILGS